MMGEVVTFPSSAAPGDAPAVLWSEYRRMVQRRDDAVDAAMAADVEVEVCVGALASVVGIDRAAQLTRLDPNDVRRAVDAFADLADDVGFGDVLQSGPASTLGRPR